MAAYADGGQLSEFPAEHPHEVIHREAINDC
jgi:hypothetical protein